MALKPRKSRTLPPPQGCPMGACMALLGGAWTPNVVWQLSGGPRRFGELIRDIPGVSPKVLTERLRTLEDKGVITRAVAPTSPPSVEYALSSLGEELVPVIHTIVHVGTQLLDAPPRNPPGRSRGRH